MAARDDEALLEVYRQAGQNARMYAGSRFSNLTGFLTYMSVLTAALAFLYGDGEDPASFQLALGIVALLGVVLSVLFLALEVRHHHWWEYYEFEVIARLEREMGLRQYPADARVGGSRAFVSRGKKSVLGLSATRATYGIYLTTMVFFTCVGTASLVL
jgi:hypothetical protein